MQPRLFKLSPALHGENIIHGASQSERFVVGFLGILFSFSRFDTLPVGLALKRHN